MTTYLVRRILALIPVMAVVVTVVFLLIHLIPGDPVAVMLGPDATLSQIETARQALGLDRARLADTLDSEAARARRLESTNREIAQRLDAAIASIQSVLDANE